MHMSYLVNYVLASFFFIEPHFRKYLNETRFVPTTSVRPDVIRCPLWYTFLISIICTVESYPDGRFITYSSSAVYNDFHTSLYEIFAK